MQLKLLQQQFEKYKSWLKSKEADKHIFIWESQRLFQKNWNMETDNFATMYDRSLQNKHTRRLWKRERYEPKRVMLKFARMQPDFVKHAFKDLFNEEISEESRVGRFVFYCDELLQAYKKEHPESIENNHYHDDDYGMVSLYLSFRYPERYTLYEPEGFLNLMKTLGSRDLPKGNDMERFFKVARTIFKLMGKDEALVLLHKKRMDASRHYVGESLLLVYDFYRFCALKK